MLLNASVINGAVLNGSAGDYKILLGSIVSNATLGQVPVLLIKPFNSSINISAIASGYDSVNWVLAANVSITATDSGYLYKTSVLDGIDGQVTSTIYGALSKSDLLQSTINAAAISSQPLLTSLISFESSVDVSSVIEASILKIDTLNAVPLYITANYNSTLKKISPLSGTLLTNVISYNQFFEVKKDIASYINTSSVSAGSLFKRDNLQSTVFINANTISILNKIDKLNGNANFSSSIEEHFFKIIKNIAATVDTDTTTESILSLIVNMDSDIICNAIISKDDLFISKNLVAIEAILAIIANAHLKHLYTHFDLEVKTDTTDIEINDISINYMDNEIEIDYLDNEDTIMIGINYERTIY